MARLKCGGVAFWFLIGAIAIPAQTGDFEEIARRASDALETNPAQAARLYQQALTLRPNWAEGWLYRGASLYQLRRYSEARDSFRKGVALDPGKGTPLAFLGLVEYELGDYRTALSHLLKGESIGLPDKPDFDREVYYRAALIYLRSGNYGQAVEQLKTLAQKDMRSDAVVSALGLSTLGLNYSPMTIPSGQQPLVNLAGRAAWAFLADRPGEAGPLFDQLRSEFPNQPGVHYMIGVFLISQDRQAAEQEFRTELRIAPGHVLARVQLAQLLSKDGTVAEALQLAAEAARLAPADALCQVTLGRTLLNAGRTLEAIPPLQRGEKLAPQVAKTHFYLLQAYRRLGRIEDAQKEKIQWERLHVLQEPRQF